MAMLAEPEPDLLSRVEELASTGSRVLAVASGLKGRLSVQGLIALADTPREDASSLVKSLQSLGVRILMVSGDAPTTARTIARKVGLGDHFGDMQEAQTDPSLYDGFAGLFPEDKLHLVEALQSSGRVVGMTGDGVNDAPALKRADVGIAVSTASDVAKASAQAVLTHPGLQGIVAIISSGRRVYRRMLTWTITKITRTVELAALLTIGYIATGIFVTPLVLIAVIIVLNDIVTITLATDDAWISPVPENWNIKEIAKIAGMLAAGWLVLAFGILWVAWNVLMLSVPEIQTLMFVYLMYSAQATIYLTRVRDHLWSFAPSRYVAAATIGNVLIASVLAYWGVLTAPVSGVLLVGMLSLVIVAAILLDQIKLWFFHSTQILGPSVRTSVH